MAFKRSDLKNWTVSRQIEVMAGASFHIDIKIISEKDGMEIVDRGSDIETAKAFVAGVQGYQNEKSEDMTLTEFWDDVSTLPPTVVHKIALECVNAQHDAALKN